MQRLQILNIDFNINIAASNYKVAWSHSLICVSKLKESVGYLETKQIYETLFISIVDDQLCLDEEGYVRWLEN